MKKYSESKKADSRARWRTKRGKSSRGKIIPRTLEIIMTGDDSVNLSIRCVCIRPADENKYICVSNKVYKKEVRYNFIHCLQHCVKRCGYQGAWYLRKGETK